MRDVTLGKWGNTLAVRIPYFVAEQMNLKAGDIMRLGCRDNLIILEAPKNP